MTKWIKEKDEAGLAPVLTWIGKLESWCTAAVESNEESADKVTNLEDDKRELESQLEEANTLVDRVDDIGEIVEDMDRGIKDMGDLRYHLDSIPARA